MPKDGNETGHKIKRWEIIAGLCLTNGYRHGAELGVSTGRFTAYLCSIMPGMRIIAVDLWVPQAKRDVAGAETYDDRPIDAYYGEFTALCEESFPGRVKILRKDTVEAANDVPDDSLDFVFIDADHTYEGCLRDIQAWTPKVRKGGLISGHDFNWPTVLQAVTETGRVDFRAADNVWGRLVR